LHRLTQTGEFPIGQLIRFGVQAAETAQNTRGEMDCEGTVAWSQLGQILVMMPGVFQPFAAFHRTEYQVEGNSTRVARTERILRAFGRIRFALWSKGSSLHRIVNIS